MTSSETWLTVVAIRLAAIVVAGCVVKTAILVQPRQAIACFPASVATEMQTPRAATGGADETLRDLSLHD